MHNTSTVKQQSRLDAVNARHYASPLSNVGSLAHNGMLTPTMTGSMFLIPLQGYGSHVGETYVFVSSVPNWWDIGSRAASTWIEPLTWQVSAVRNEAGLIVRGIEASAVDSDLFIDDEQDEMDFGLMSMEEVRGLGFPFYAPDEESDEVKDALRHLLQR